MSKDLAKIASQLFAKPMEGKDLPSRIQQLGDEIRKAIQSSDTTYGKFRGLLESFREIIPDEQQRYSAALQALSTTSKLSRQEIMKAINGQVEELKAVEKGLLPSLAGWRTGLKSMEARSRETKAEMAKLRERIAQLESEDKAVLSGMAALEKDLGQAEKTISGLFANISAEIAAISMKMEVLPAEAPPAQPVSPPKPVPSAPPAAPAVPVKSAAVAENKNSSEQTVEIQAAPSPKDTKFQKKCPMCGGPFHLLELQNMWQCYTCAYEEPAAKTSG